MESHFVTLWPSFKLLVLSGEPRQTGVWHGGVAIFARAYFHVYDMNRKANVKLHRDQDEHKKHGATWWTWVNRGIDPAGLCLWLLWRISGWWPYCCHQEQLFWSQKLGAKAYSPVYLMSLYVYLFYKYVVWYSTIYILYIIYTYYITSLCLISLTKHDHLRPLQSGFAGCFDMVLKAYRLSIGSDDCFFQRSHFRCYERPWPAFCRDLLGHFLNIQKLQPTFIERRF